MKTEKTKFRPIQTIVFFVIVFVITWAFIYPAVTIAPEDVEIFLIIPGAFGPFLAAIIVIWGWNGKAVLASWLKAIFKFKIPVVIYLFSAFLLPIIVGGMHYLLYSLLGGESDFRLASPWYLYLFYLIPTALLTGGNEEPGWRGFALPALLQWFHPVIASLIIGVIHSLWHLPMMGEYNTNMGWYLFNLVPLTFIFNWLYLKSRKSIFPVMLFHASTNVLSEFIPTPQVLLGGIGNYMVMRGLVYWILAIVILIFTKGRLGYVKPTVLETIVPDLTLTTAEATDQ